MAPVYKLKYFSYMGLVEPIRYLLAYGNIEYENVVIPDAEWSKLQKVVPFSKLPILDVDGKPLFHSVAISQYLGKLLGLLPFENWEYAELDGIVQVTYELGWQVWNWQQQVNQELKNVIGKELMEVIIPKWLADFEGILKKKGTYFGGMKLSWADFYVVSILEFVQLAFNKSWVPKYSLLQQLTLEVQSIPAIKSYINKRPNYKY